MAKGKGFIGEFKEFIMRGNVIDLAVGVIIGGAFQKIVDSLVNDMIMPLIGMITGNIDFSQRVWKVGEGDFAATVCWGKFITAVLNFLVMAFVIFLIIKAINTVSEKVRKKEEIVEEAPATKVCPFCKSEVAVDAVKCPHCTADIPDEK
ncbi:MAG: large conductance mechanosensitive channel protein MscL [Ruminococcus sp.]|nr:large conductance mechanosensitive channel protein MscL [Candidatus Copronaster equi]